jgi:predicted metal-dependent phosphoesterase TrpH
LEALIGEIDFIEALNSRIVFAVHNKLALEFARRHDKPVTAASDAHSPREVGRSYVEMPAFTVRPMRASVSATMRPAAAIVSISRGDLSVIIVPESA